MCIYVYTQTHIFSSVTKQLHISNYREWKETININIMRAKEDHWVSHPGSHKGKTGVK
jgi:hypothetical protein